MSHLTENLHLLRKKVWKENQEVFGQRLGIERSTYARIEAGGYNLSLDAALRLSDLTGVSVEDFNLKKLSEKDFPARPLNEGGEAVLREPGNPGYKKETPDELMDIRKLVEAVKQLQAENEKLKERLTYLENKLRETDRPF